MALIYVELMKRSAPEFARALRILSDPANHPAVIHCSAGKDRTGLLVVLIHLIAGVPLDAALVHYEQVGAAASVTHAEKIGRYPGLASLPQAKIERMSGVSRRWVLSALAVASGHGGLSGWLEENGCDSHHQNRLRTSLMDRG